MGPERLEQAVVLEVAGPELEDQRPHLGEGLALEVAQRAEPLLGRRRDRGRRGAPCVRVTRVMLNRAWVTESWSSRARWARSWLDASSPAWRRRFALEPLALGDVAGRAVDPGERSRRPSSPIELTSTGTVPPSLWTQLELDDLARRPARRRARAQRSTAAAWIAGSTTFEKCSPTSSPWAEAGHRLDRLGHEREHALVVGREDDVRRVLDEEAVALLGVAQLALESLPLGDVAGGALDPGEDAVAADADRADLERQDPAVGGPEH